MCLAQGPQRSDAGEVQIRVPSVLSQALSHCAPFDNDVLKYHVFCVRLRSSGSRIFLMPILARCLHNLNYSAAMIHIYNPQTWSVCGSNNPCPGNMCMFHQCSSHNASRLFKVATYMHLITDEECKGNWWLYWTFGEFWSR